MNTLYGTDLAGLWPQCVMTICAMVPFIGFILLYVRNQLFNHLHCVIESILKCVPILAIMVRCYGM